MKLWKEVGPTLFTAAALTLALSVTQGWDWPWLADARAGIIALGVVGFGACILSGSAGTRFSVKDPFVIVAMVAGIVLLGSGVIGLFANTMPYLIVMMGATFALWLVATARHLVEGGPNPRFVPTT
jgi:hypothetical protein